MLCGSDTKYERGQVGFVSLSEQTIAEKTLQCGVLVSLFVRTGTSCGGRGDAQEYNLHVQTSSFLFLMHTCTQDCLAMKM